ncbi:MAG: ComF family protein, partial [Gammaproteobacteria bacterium]
MVYQWVNKLQNAIFPHHCRLCLAPIDILSHPSLNLCEDCLNDLPWISHHCQQCARPLPETGGNICGQCQRQPPAFQHCIALLAYTYPVDQLIIRIKFSNDLVLSQTLGKLLSDRLQQTVKQWPDLILPVPLHRKRLAERGYNQALELARPIAAITGIPIKSRLCKRIINTRTQSLLPVKDRRNNLRDAFKVCENIQDAHIAIIDDV